jgi:hypothetical protein
MLSVVLLLFGDWILSPSSGGTYSVGPNTPSYSLSPADLLLYVQTTAIWIDS